MSLRGFAVSILIASWALAAGPSCNGFRRAGGHDDAGADRVSGDVATAVDTGQDQSATADRPSELETREAGAESPPAADTGNDGALVDSVGGDAVRDLPPDLSTKALGDPCTLASAADCPSGFCVDGRCCALMSCGTCESCTGAAGSCAQVVRKEDPGTCEGLQLCSATGRCIDRITEFTIPTANTRPLGIVTGSDGNLWFVESQLNKIARINTLGSGYVEFSSPFFALRENIAVGPDRNFWFPSGDAIIRMDGGGTPTPPFMLAAGSGPFGVVAGPDGNMWFAESSSNAIGRMGTDGGNLVEYLVPTAGALPADITVGADTNIWFTEFAVGKIGRVNRVAGTVTEFPIPTANSQPQGITLGPDSNVWFVEYGGNKIGRIDRNGVIREFTVPTGGQLLYITTGPDSNLWFTENYPNKIGRMDVNGVATEFQLPSPTGGVYHIAAGPDGNLWFTEVEGNKVGRIIP
jgi:streptogramin lyase